MFWWSDFFTNFWRILFHSREWRGWRGTPTLGPLPFLWRHILGPLRDPLERFPRRPWGKLLAQVGCRSNFSPIFPHFVFARARSRQPKNHPGHSPIHLHHAADTDDRVIPNLNSLSCRTTADPGRSATVRIARELTFLGDRDGRMSVRSRRIPASDVKTSRGKCPNVLKSENVHRVRNSHEERHGVKMRKRRWWAGPSWWDPRRPPSLELGRVA